MAEIAEMKGEISKIIYFAGIKKLIPAKNGRAVNRTPDLSQICYMQSERCTPEPHALIKIPGPVFCNLNVLVKYYTKYSPLPT